MSRPPRLASFDYVGLHRYFLTICAHERRAVFANADVVNSAMLQFRRTAVVEGFSFLAYCWMPDHGHSLVEGTHDAADFRRFAKLAKQRSGAVEKRARGAHLWQEGYYERVLRDDDDIRTIARYILANPVRAGLVRTPYEYPYVGSDVWSVRELFEGLY